MTKKNSELDAQDAVKKERRMDVKIPAKAKDGIRVLSVDDGQRMDRWCKAYLKDVPYTGLHKMLRKGLIRVDGKKIAPDGKLKAGQVVSVKQDFVFDAARSRGATEHVVAALSDEMIREVRSWVLYKDAQMIIINKPYGLAVQGGSRITKHLDMYLPALQYEMDAPPKLVHRLDKDTSGVLVLGRTREAAAQLQKGFANKRLRKMYVALCLGVPKQYSGEIVSLMEKSLRGKDSREVVSSGKEGKKAVTRYNVREAMAGKFSLIDLEPVTGRTHQLRVHMAELGCPIMGDGKYGGSEAFARGTVEISNALHLHAWQIVIPQAGGKLLTVSAPFPAHVQQSAKALNLNLPKIK